MFYFFALSRSVVLENGRRCGLSLCSLLWFTYNLSFDKPRFLFVESFRENVCMLIRLSHIPFTFAAVKSSVSDSKDPINVKVRKSILVFFLCLTEGPPCCGYVHLQK